MKKLLLITVFLAQTAIFSQEQVLDSVQIYVPRLNQSPEYITTTGSFKEMYDKMDYISERRKTNEVFCLFYYKRKGHNAQYREVRVFYKEDIKIGL